MADDLFGYREEQRTRSFDNCQPRGKEIEKCTVVSQLVPFFIDGTDESLYKSNEWQKVRLRESINKSLRVR